MEAKLDVANGVASDEKIKSQDELITQQQELLEMMMNRLEALEAQVDAVAGTETVGSVDKK
jgi:hypothetical protein